MEYLARGLSANQVLVCIHDLITIQEDNLQNTDAEVTQSG